WVPVRTPTCGTPGDRRRGSVHGQDALLARALPQVRQELPAIRAFARPLASEASGRVRVHAERRQALPEPGVRIGVGAMPRSEPTIEGQVGSSDATLDAFLLMLACGPDRRDDRYDSVVTAEDPRR